MLNQSDCNALLVIDCFVSTAMLPEEERDRGRGAGRDRERDGHNRDRDGSGKPPLGPGGGGGGGGGTIGYNAASMSASQVAALIGGTPSNDRDTQERLNKLFASMTRAQLWEVMREVKTTVCRDKAQAKQYFLERPSLAKALFQAQVLLGMVKAPSPPAVPPPVPPPEPVPQPQPPVIVPAPTYGAAAAAEAAGGGGYGRPPRTFPSPGPFQEGPMGLGGRSQMPGG
jgi:hypothetical protein